MEIAIMQHEEIQHNMLVMDEKQETTLNANAKSNKKLQTQNYYFNELWGRSVEPCGSCPL
jgi:hypothetical protein